MLPNKRQTSYKWETVSVSDSTNIPYWAVLKQFSQFQFHFIWFDDVILLLNLSKTKQNQTKWTHKWVQSEWSQIVFYCQWDVIKIILFVITILLLKIRVVKFYICFKTECVFSVMMLSSTRWFHFNWLDICMCIVKMANIFTTNQSIYWVYPITIWWHISKNYA